MSHNFLRLLVTVVFAIGRYVLLVKTSRPMSGIYFGADAFKHLH